MFRRDLSHTGSTDPRGAVARGTLKWVFSSGGAIHSSAAIANGIVYVGSRDGKLYALKASTGIKIWEFQTGSWVDSSPAISDGVVYFGSNDGGLYALDALNGEKLWFFKTRYGVRSSPAVAGDKEDYAAKVKQNDATIGIIAVIATSLSWPMSPMMRVTRSPVRFLLW